MFTISFELDKHIIDIKLINFFCEEAIRGIWSDKAVMTSQWVLGCIRHKDLNDFLKQTHNDCTAVSFKYHSGDP